MNEISEGIKMAEELLRTINAEKLKAFGKVLLYAFVMGTGIGGVIVESENIGVSVKAQRDVEIITENTIEHMEKVPKLLHEKLEECNAESDEAPNKEKE